MAKEELIENASDLAVETTAEEVIEGATNSKAGLFILAGVGALAGLAALAKFVVIPQVKKFKNRKNNGLHVVEITKKDDEEDKNEEE